MSLVETVKRLCSTTGTTIPRLEKSLGFGKGSVYNWDKSSPSIDKVQKVAAHFCVSVDSILSGDKVFVDDFFNEVIDYCANPECAAEIYFGQPATKIGHELVCSGRCLVEKIGAVTVIAGKVKSG